MTGTPTRIGERHVAAVLAMGGGLMLGPAATEHAGPSGGRAAPGRPPTGDRLASAGDRLVATTDRLVSAGGRLAATTDRFAPADRFAEPVAAADPAAPAPPVTGSRGTR
ncbi:hypothetical protein [Streptomyces roseolilacinus]|uniref:hypothetical protein n=1 Tax=Streptomyces roseolilacinus TaxID=66904 RepID=UPI0037F425E1